MTYKVSVEYVQVYPHPNGDNLELVGIGDNQYVVQKGLYKTNDLAVAIPKNSIVSHPVFIREWGDYLQGSDKNRVGFKIMRGQESQGIVVREDLVKEITGLDIKDFEVGVDISAILGISKYIPTISIELKDSVEVLKEELIRLVEHDCRYAITSLAKFKEEDSITITSKIHGTQANYICLPNKNVIISSKGLLDQALVFKQNINNIYSQAWHNTFDDSMTNGLFWNTLSDIIRSNALEQQVQVIGEVIPAINGFNYGFTRPTLYIYSIYVNGKPINLTQFRRLPNIYIVPELYKGSFDSILTMEIAKEFAQQAVCPIDGNTINEGVVITNGKYFIKVKNDKFMKKYEKEQSD